MILAECEPADAEENPEQPSPRRFRPQAVIDALRTTEDDIESSHDSPHCSASESFKNPQFKPGWLGKPEHHWSPSYEQATQWVAKQKDWQFRYLAGTLPKEQVLGEA